MHVRWRTVTLSAAKGLASLASVYLMREALRCAQGDTRTLWTSPDMSCKKHIKTRNEKTDQCDYIMDRTHITQEKSIVYYTILWYTGCRAYLYRVNW